MTAPTPDEAARVLRIAARHDVPQPPPEAIKVVLAERDSLRARLAAQQPVIDAAEAQEARVLDLLRRCEDEDEEVTTDAIRAALLGSVEADTPPSGTSGHEADTPAEPGWEVHVAATGTPAGLRFTERGDAKAAADSLNAIVGRPWYDVSEAVEPASDDETAHGYVVARMTDATAYHGDRVLTLWSDDVHRTLTGASDRHVEDIDEPDDWEVYELRRVTIPLAGVDAPTEPADDGFVIHVESATPPMHTRLIGPFVSRAVAELWWDAWSIEHLTSSEMVIGPLVSPRHAALAEPADDTAQET